MTQKILIGCDPELFAISGGYFRSVHNDLPGTKENPVRVPDGAIQVDGVAAEFNIDPAEDVETFYKRVTGVQGFMTRLIRTKLPSVRLIAAPVARFDENYFKTLPATALLLGCEPDYNAYTGKENNKPSTNKPMRTGSGHIHIGWKDSTSEFNKVGSAHFKECCSLVQDLDATLGRASTLWDKDVERRELYGQDGAFRPKPYGVEYRVLSNAWLNFEESIKFVFEMSKAVTLRHLRGESVSKDFAKRTKPNSLRGLFHDFEILGLPTPNGTLAKDI